MNQETTQAWVYLNSPTNSQMFTTCCDVAICSDQRKCPSCDKLVYGWDAKTEHDRSRQRWQYAFKGKNTIYR